MLLDFSCPCCSEHVLSVRFLPNEGIPDVSDIFVIDLFVLSILELTLPCEISAGQVLGLVQ